MKTKKQVKRWHWFTCSWCRHRQASCTNIRTCPKCLGRLVRGEAATSKDVAK